MNNLETLKEELLTQKAAVESKGGTVIVANTNPSPSEITDGINSIVVPDVSAADAAVGDVRSGKTFYSGSNTLKTGTLNVIDTSVATATAEDVTSGKTFYAGNDTLKTGTSQVVTGALANATVGDVEEGKTFYAGDNTLKTGTLQHGKIMKSMLFYTTTETSQPERINVYAPSDSIKISKYMCWNNYNPVNFYFNPGTTLIPTYAFYGTKNFNFPNFTDLSSLVTIDTYAFYNSNKSAFDFQTWPSHLEVIDNRAFQETLPSNIDLILPTTLKRVGIYAFCSTSVRIELNSISMPSYNYYLIPSGLYYLVSANCDYTPPSCATNIGTQFNMRGSFNNVTIPATISRIENYAFGSVSTDAVSWFHMNSFTFLSQTPPYIGTEIIAPQNLQNSSFRIYVPDTAVNTYKAVSNLQPYASVIVGESERP